ncbi:MAG: DUF58 domain-containing protein [Clostridia bacterium]|nr:DUF58 domain-containing protein [Clostridia bacterium]
MVNSSLFATLPGLLLLFALTVTAAYFDAPLIAAFLLLLLVVSAGARLWSRSVLKQTDVSIADGQRACHAGETLDFRFCVRSRSFFPLIWLDVVLPLAIKEKPRLIGEGDDPDALIALPYESPLVGLRERFAWLLWQHEIICEERLTALRRGVVTISKASLQAGDGLGMAACQRWTSLSSPVQLTVYPRLTEVDVSPFLRLIQDAEAGRRGQAEDVTLLRSSRPYQHGDPMRRINWRRLAASGAMETNQYEMITPGCITFLLELSTFGYTETIIKDAATKAGDVTRPAVREVDLERMISVIASVIRALCEKGQRFALVIPGYDGRETAILRAAGGEEGYMLAMETLAQIDYRGTETNLSDEARALRRKLGIVFLCTWENTPAAQTYEALGFLHLRQIAVRRSKESAQDNASCMLLESIERAHTQEGGV